MKIKGISWIVFHIMNLYKGVKVSQTTKSVCIRNTFKIELLSQERRVI